MTAPFKLSRATSADMPQLIRMMRDSFPAPFIREQMMGCATEAELPRSVDYYREHAGPHDVWLKVTDVQTGEVVAGSNWRVYTDTAPASADDEPPAWIEGETREKALALIGAMNDRRRKAMDPSGGFVYLHILFTSDKYRRRGAGALMVKWGCDTADQLFLPAWVEASPEGRPLYETFGFDEYEIVPGEMVMCNMRREVKVSAMEGGRPS